MITSVIFITTAIRISFNYDFFIHILNIFVFDFIHIKHSFSFIIFYKIYKKNRHVQYEHKIHFRFSIYI